MADDKKPADTSKYWCEQLDLANKDHKDWLDAGDAVVKRYKRGKERGGQKKLNILYSNTEHLRAALYGRSAKPDVRRRFGAEDKVAQIAGEVIEKGLIYCNDTYDNDRQIELGLLDYLLPGRGVVRVEYEPVIREGQIVEQKLCDKFVYWKDFRCMPARTWGDIQKNGWIAFRHTMTRTELIDNFGQEIGSEVPLNWVPDAVDQKPETDELLKAEVWEIWDIVSKKRYWIVEGYSKELRADDDPYLLMDFFPLPEPPSYYFTTDTIIPEPEFHVYSDQADDLDEITNRISRLTKALKRRGVYNASVKELQRLAGAGDNVFIPVENWGALAAGGGLEKAFETEDISLIATVLLNLYQYRDLLIQAIWELIGIADIMRGASQASETLGAQELKAQFGSQRLKKRQRSIQQWVAGLLKIKAEILAEHFEPQILQEMTGVMLVPPPPPPPPVMVGDGITNNSPAIEQYQEAILQHQAQVQEIQGVMELLRSDKLRSYRIDVETDSTVFEDAEAEKASRGKMIEAVTMFTQAWGPMVAAAPELGPVAFEFLKFGVGAFKGTRAIDDAIEQAAGAFASKPPQQDPAAAAEAQKVKLEQEEAAREEQRAMREEQREEQKAIREEQREDAKMRRDEQREDYKLEKNIALEEYKAAKKAELDEKNFERQASLEREKMEHTTSLENKKADHQAGLEEKKVGAKVVSDIALGLQKNSAEQKANDDNSEVMKEVSEALSAIAKGQEQTAEALMALAAPRRRVAVRDEEGRMVEAHDMPMER
jgi:hypothetical protein